MPELGTSGSVRGDASNGIPYRDKAECRAPHPLSVTSLQRLRLGRHGISHKTRLQSKGQTGPRLTSNPYPLHQRDNMLTANLKAFGLQQITQRAAACERKIEMQFLHPPH
jgi:hypothetical protein